MGIGFNTFCEDELEMEGNFIQPMLKFDLGFGGGLGD